MTLSPFILKRTIADHLKKFMHDDPAVVEAIQKYVDDVIHAVNTEEEAEMLKKKSIDIFADGGFELHKWHSNVYTLDDQNSNTDGEVSYAKQKFGGDVLCTKIFGIHRNKGSDEMAIKIPKSDFQETKRGALKFLASIYDPLGMISPFVLGKCIFRELCETKHSWDEQMREEILATSFKRAICDKREPMIHVDLH